MVYFFDSVLAKVLAGVCAIIAFAMAIGQVNTLIPTTAFAAPLGTQFYFLFSSFILLIKPSRYHL
jgi:hypothetical protein